MTAPVLISVPRPSWAPGPTRAPGSTWQPTPRSALAATTAVPWVSRGSASPLAEMRSTIAVRPRPAPNPSTTAANPVLGQALQIAAGPDDLQGTDETPAVAGDVVDQPFERQSRRGGQQLDHHPRVAVGTGPVDDRADGHRIAISSSLRAVPRRMSIRWRTCALPASAIIRARTGSAASCSSVDFHSAGSRSSSR